MRSYWMSYSIKAAVFIILWGHATMSALPGETLLETSEPPDRALVKAIEIREADAAFHAARRAIYAEAAVQRTYGSDENTPLMLAAQAQQLLIVDLLLEHGADPNRTNANGVSVLEFAHANLLITKLLLDSGADLARFGSAALEQAAGSNSIPVAHYLLSRSDFPASADGETLADALRTAIRWDHIRMARLLLENGAPVAIRNAHTGSREAFIAKINSAEMLKLLLQFGADPDDVGENLFMYSVGGDTDRMAILLEAGASPESRNEFGYSLLYLAVGGGHSETVELLLKYGANPNAEFDNHSLLYYARLKGVARIAQLLRNAGARDESQLPEIKFADAQEARNELVNAAQHGNLRSMRAALAAGADINKAWEYSGQSAIGETVRGCYPEALEFLLEQRASVADARENLLLRALQENCLSCARILLKHGVNTNNPPVLPHVYAFPDSIRLLLEFDADVNTQSEEGYSALHRAVIHHELESARILLRANSDLTQSAWYRGRRLTPEQIAAASGDLEMMRLFELER